MCIVLVIVQVLRYYWNYADIIASLFPRFLTVPVMIDFNTKRSNMVGAQLHGVKEILG